MAPTAIPLAKQALRRLRAQDAVTVAARAIRARTAAEGEKLLVDFVSSGEPATAKQNIEG
jgi:phosphoenolpyruvate-protein kinase (PTS system EI component)